MSTPNDIQSAMWQVIGMRGGLRSIPQEDLAVLVEAIAAGITANTGSQPASPQRTSQPTTETTEQPVWEGDAKDLSNVASGGRVAQARYRLTTRTLYFQYGIVSTTAEQIPLWAIRDIDLKQSMTQKVRGVGNVIVHVQHSDYAGRSEVVLENIEQPSNVRDLINQHAQRKRLEHERRAKTRYTGRQ